MTGYPRFDLKYDCKLCRWHLRVTKPASEYDRLWFAASIAKHMADEHPDGPPPKGKGCFQRNPNRVRDPARWGKGGPPK
jgi:hypothetical protein